MATSSETAAAVKLQCLFRTRRARQAVKLEAKLAFEQVLDEASGAYFFYNTKTGQSSWTKPKILETVLTPRARKRLVCQEDKRKRGVLKKAKDMTDEEAALFIQNLFRTRMARKRLRELIQSVYQKSYDDEGNAFYYNTKTGESSWDRPVLLGGDDLDDPYYYADYEQAQVPYVDTREGKVNIETVEEMHERVERRKQEGAIQVKAFLKYYDLEVVLDELLAEGFDDMDAITAMQEADVDELGIKKKYREPLYDAVVDYRTKNDIPDPFEVESDDDDEESSQVKGEDTIKRGMTAKSKKSLGGESGDSDEEVEDEQYRQRMKKKRSTVKTAIGAEDGSDEGKSDDEEKEGKDVDGEDREGDEQSVSDEEGFEEDDSVAGNSEILGVQKEVLFEGDGKHFPHKGQFVMVHYVASLENGTVFQSSRKMGRPFDFLVGANHVIAGLDRGIRTMSRGERAILTIQPEMGYGEKGRPPVVPRNAVLRFEVEFIDNYFAPVGQLEDSDDDH